MDTTPWFKFWPEGVPRSLAYPEAPLSSLLEDAARKYPNKTAVKFLGASLTYGSLNELANRFAAALTALGVSKGSRVALVLPNTPQFVICFYGTLKVGGIVVPCNPLYKEHELEVQLNDSQAEVAVAANNVASGLDLFTPLQNVRGKTKLRHVIATSLTDFLSAGKRLLAPLAGVKRLQAPDSLSLMTLLKTHPPSPPSLTVNAKEDVAVLQYTGGTTGTPKGAMLSHHNVLSNAAMTASWLPLTPSDVNLAVLPFFHIYGLTTTLNAPFYAGSSVVILPRFEAEPVLKTIEREGVTVFCGVPAMYAGLLKHPALRKHKLDTIRRCISGAAPLLASIMSQFSEVTGGRLVEGYGLSEASPVTHCNPLDDMKKVKPGSIGIPFMDTQARIVNLDDSSKELAAGEVGELAVKGPQVMLGYWNKPKETDAVLRKGWLLTGDIARMDEDGYFWIVDRKKDMINVGGFKVWPSEVEETLQQHAAVEEAAAVSAPHPERGEVVKAYVVLKGESRGKVTSEELIEFCKQKLAPHKVPKVVEFRDSLPKTMIGKILRRNLRVQT